MKVAIVLGGTAGVGRATVEMLVEEGYTIGVIARGGDRVAALDEAYDGKVRALTADVADDSALEAAVNDLVGQLGEPTVWVNNAMATSFSYFTDMSADEFERVVQVTFIGQVNGTRAALRHMKRGKIICIGSGLGYRSVPLQSAYCASKHAINGFVASVRSELIRERSKITIHLVQLPALNTPQFDWARHRFQKQPQPAPPIYAPEVASSAVRHVLERGSREVLVGRSVIQLLFANFVLPNWMDHKMASSGGDMQKSETPDDPQSGNLFQPVEHEGTSDGSYGERASSNGLIVDADLARKLVFFGGAAALFILGLIVG